MSLSGFALKRPYTIISLIMLVCLLAGGSVLRMPVDIFPEINIPVAAVVWTYNGMSAPEMQNRILTFHERQLASQVDDIARIEANSYGGIGVIKVYLHEGADVTRAVAQLGSSALVVLKYMPRNITPPMVLRYGATDVPILQLSLSSRSLTDTKLNDLGQPEWKDNVLHPADVDLWLSSVIPLQMHFLRRGYLGQWQAVVGRFRAIRSHAKGPQSWVAAAPKCLSSPSQEPTARSSRRSRSPRTAR